MRILFVPRDTFNLRSNEHVADRIHILEGKNTLVGVRRSADFTRGMPGLSAYARFLRHGLKVFFFGLGHRRDFDLVYCFETAYSMAGVGIAAFTGRPCVRDAAGVPWEWVERVKPPLLLRLGVSVTEKIAKRFARLHVVLSEADRKAYIEHGYDPEKVVAIPLLADFNLVSGMPKAELRAKLGLGSSPLLLFSGKRDYPPNYEAAAWINGTLAPAIARRVPGARVLMTSSGRKPAPEHPILTYTGYVPDLFEYIGAADVFIAPIEMPSGRLTKVFDSLSGSTPTVVLASACNGIPELKDGDNVMIARDRDEFIDKTIYLLDHPAEAHEIGRRGRQMLEEHYDWTFWENKLNEALESCFAHR